ILTTPGEKDEAESKHAQFYTELWFVILMAILGLILLAVFLSLVLRRQIKKQRYTRERPPLVPLQKRTSPMTVYSPGNTHMFDSVAEMSDSASSVTLKGFTMHFEGLADTKIPGPSSPLSNHSNQSTSVLRIPSQSQMSHTCSQGSLHRSVSQLIDVYDKKSLIEDSVWDTIIHGHDGSLYMDNEDLVNAMKGFSTVTKEHTTFTDTHL
uniref:Usherin n=1 Tax=Pelodiscus sinensis TaxID=13735 RepID=K7FEY8_PELSI